MKDFVGPKGWTSVIVPMDLNGDKLARTCFSYNKTTGRAVFSTCPPSLRERRWSSRAVFAPTGWTALVPMSLNGDCHALTDLLSYNATTGRTVLSTGAFPPGTQTAVEDFRFPGGSTSLFPMNLNHEGLVDVLNHTDPPFYNKTTGQAGAPVAPDPSGTLRGVQDFLASTGWTAVVPMVLQPDATGGPALLQRDDRPGRLLDLAPVPRGRRRSSRTPPLPGGGRPSSR